MAIPISVKIGSYRFELGMAGIKKVSICSIGIHTYLVITHSLSSFMVHHGGGDISKLKIGTAFISNTHVLGCFKSCIFG